MSAIGRRTMPALVATMLGSLLLTGCFLKTMNQPPVQPEREELSRTVARASQEVLASHYAAADSMLSDFTNHHPVSPEGAEAAYWRAVYLLDPDSPIASPRDAERIFFTYLASPWDLEHRATATTLRRVAQSLDRSTVAAATAVQSAPPTTTAAPSVQTPTAPSPAAQAAADRARDEELQRLRDELAKANAELERIRRRLAQPKP